MFPDPEGDKCPGEGRAGGVLRIGRLKLIGGVVGHDIRCLWGEAKYVKVHSMNLNQNRIIAYYPLSP